MAFAHALMADGLLAGIARVRAELYGGLAFHGREHSSGAALVAGLVGLPPDACDAGALARCEALARRDGRIALAGRHRIHFDPARDVRYVVDRSLAQDGSAMRFVALDLAGDVAATRTYLSAGGGAIILEGEPPPASARRVPYPYASAGELVDIARANGKRIHDLARANECALASPGEVERQLARVASVMHDTVTRGLAAEGALPGGRPRTARLWHEASRHQPPAQRCIVYATAAGEENAAGGTIVAAPSAGAAGPVAALLFLWQAQGAFGAQRRTGDFLLAAAAVGGVLRHAGVTHVGCQGEIGVAAAMAAAGYAAVQEASNAQVLHAAALALEPHLGLACDLAAGRIEDPCIERGALAAERAHDAAVAALRVPAPRLALDHLARAMVASGRGLSERPKAASIGGIACNVVEC